MFREFPSDCPLPSQDATEPGEKAHERVVKVYGLEDPRVMCHKRG